MADARLWTPSLGAIPAGGGAAFSVWAPEASQVDLVLENGGTATMRRLTRDRGGMFTGWARELAAGARYRFSVDGGPPLPDPASRSQPDGVHGASALVDPSTFVWTDGGWPGRGLEALVIYELHVGTFSPEGTFAGVEAKLAYLASLGVTAVELMPIAAFAGARNWGYDGVDLFAPSHHYGTPDDLRRLVDAAHAHGLAVILDVVYNHLGPDGAYLASFSPQYFSRRRTTCWGAAINLDEEGGDRVRAFFIENALHWIHEYHVDGLRLDATHALVDASRPHFLAELAASVRQQSGRPVLLIAEDERNDAALVHAPPRGHGLDAVWADDFHHQLRVALAGERDGYFADFDGTAAAIATTIRRGWFYTGQTAPATGAPRGTDPAGLDPSRFVVCLQNHDQVGNRAVGDRLHHRVELAAYRAASALLLWLPQTPLLFMGQEWAASTPFLFFTDHHVELGRLITAGRRDEFAAFAAFADPDARSRIPDPQDPATWSRSRLQWDERHASPHAGVERLYRELLRLRREDAALGAAGARFDVGTADEQTIVVARGPWLLAVRLRGAGTVSLGGGRYRRVLTTDDPAFGGTGAALSLELGDTAVAHFAAPAAILLRRCAE